MTLHRATGAATSEYVDLGTAVGTAVSTYLRRSLPGTCEVSYAPTGALKSITWKQPANQHFKIFCDTDGVLSLVGFEVCSLYAPFTPLPPSNPETTVSKKHTARIENVRKQGYEVTISCPSEEKEASAQHQEAEGIFQSFLLSFDAVKIVERKLQPADLADLVSLAFDTMAFWVGQDQEVD